MFMKLVYLPWTIDIDDYVYLDSQYIYMMSKDKKLRYMLCIKQERKELRV